MMTWKPWKEVGMTYSMLQDILWKADSHSACQTTACFLYGAL